MNHGRVIAPYYTHCPPQSQPQPPHAARVPVPYHGAPNLQAPDLLQPYHHPYQPMGNSAPYQPRTIEAFPPPPPHSLDHGPGVAASTAAAAATTSGRVSRSGASLKYAYFLDRGDGKVTRLVPADMLPPLAGILSQEPLGPGMQILPSLYGKPPSGVQAMNAPVVVKDTAEAQPITAPKKGKLYCDHWVHTGDCRFMQQGCRFKHEMPKDKATQELLGLTRGLPRWWKARYGGGGSGMTKSVDNTVARGGGGGGGGGLRPEWRQNATSPAVKQLWEEPQRDQQQHDIRRG
ncbi:hypothetical protein N3K66_004239 [Trichothecium roseum]|uniref:Uncharacterized protein n=1 Tax=Trichothecium roseum TaxID=47278 RepID=A0ACC0V0T6_9HYPO|nr:hypothetical protein N3K66_004239 [Trichothecium roseum]